MTTTKDEFLSALVDDELGDFERRRLLDELGADPELAGRWGRYHLIGEALRGGLPARTDMGFAERLRAQLADEAPLEVEPGARVSAAPERPRRAGHPVIGLALAASVAAVTVIGVQSLLGERTTGQTQVVEAPAPVAGSAPRVAAAASEAQSEAVQRVRAVNPLITSSEDAVRLNSYLITHSEHSAAPGLLPQVRVVGYTSEPE
jgi:sigma-E factor negative regulatory protein RseA